MEKLFAKVSGRAVIRLAAITGLGLMASGCSYYDDGLGYSGGNYANSRCDPYNEFDSYYSCDYGYGFANIGYGGGWYNNYYYPGYGFYLFDTYGRRHNMHRSHRRYWGQQRYNWYRGRGHHKSRGGHRRGHHNGRGHSDNSGYDTIGWPEQNGGRVRDGKGHGRHDGHAKGAGTSAMANMRIAAAGAAKEKAMAAVCGAMETMIFAVM